MIQNAEMGIYILGNILQTRCMALVFINLAMDTGMREPGMREEGRDLVHTLSEMVRHNLVTGKMGFLMFIVHKTPILDLPMLSLNPESLMLSRYCSCHCLASIWIH